MTTLYQKKNYTQGHLRNEIVHRIKEQKQSYRNVCKDLWIRSTWTISRWVNRETIKSKSSAPIYPNRKYEFTELYYLYAVKKYCNLHLDDCIDILNEKYGIQFKRSSASYYLNKRKLTKKFKPKPEYQKFKEYDVGYIHIDLTYWPKIDWKKTYIYVAIDRKTRIMYLELHENKQADTAAQFLRNVEIFFPFQIHTILTDNWKEFSLKNHKWKYDLIGAFDKVCEEFDIEHRTTLPYTPKTNWMVEKCNDTVKTNTVEKTIYENMEQMDTDLIAFMLFYNLYRRHWWIVKEIRKKTPYDALQHYYEITPELFTETPEQFRKKLYKIAKKEKIIVHKRRKM